MKQLKYFFLLFLVFSFLSSCKTDEKQVAPSVELTPKQVPQAPEQIPELLSKSTFTKNEWLVKHISINGQMQNEEEKLGSIVSFDNEGNYKWIGKNTKNTGVWSIDTIRNIVLLESTDTNLTSEWTVKHKRAVMVWVGTSTYGQHSTQMMLNKVRNVDQIKK